VTETHSTRCCVCKHKLRGDEDQVCNECVSGLDTALAEVLSYYALLPVVIEPGAVPLSDEPHGKQAFAPVPLRLDVVDMLDDRPVHQFRGAERDVERHGVVGLLARWADNVRERRRISLPTEPATVFGEVVFLRRHLDWISQQDFIAEFAREILALHRDLQTIWGERPKDKSIGRCPATKLVDDDEWSVCNAPLFAPITGDTVQCNRCKTIWRRDKWLLLGRIIEQNTTEETA